MKLGKLSRRATAAAIGGALALTGVGVGTAAVLSSPATSTASDDTAVTEPAATSSSAEETAVAEPTQAQPPVEQPVQAAPTTTVAPVTSNQRPAPASQAMTVAPGVTPIDPDDLARGGHDAAGNYVGAINGPGQPMAVPPPPPLPYKPLPGEPGYVAP